MILPTTLRVPPPKPKEPHSAFPPTLETAPAANGVYISPNKTLLIQKADKYIGFLHESRSVAKAQISETIRTALLEQGISTFSPLQHELVKCLTGVSKQWALYKGDTIISTSHENQHI